jgi:alcohol dehydrogenase
MRQASIRSTSRSSAATSSVIALSAGARATRFKPGDAVYLRSSRETIGTFAEKIALSETFVALKPARISHAEAASLPLVGLTTLQGFAKVGARAGQRILIHAGAGGIGTFAVQYAKHLGLHVTTTTSAKNADFVTSLGADRAIAYDRENYLEQGGGYDIVYDTLGGAFTVDAFKLVKRGGAVISLSGPPDRDFARREGAGLLVRVAVWLMSRKVYAASVAAGASYCWFFTEANGDQLREIAGLVDAGAIKPVIDREFAFTELPAALAYLEKGHARGKVVLKVR